MSIKEHKEEEEGDEDGNEKGVREKVFYFSNFYYLKRVGDRMSVIFDSCRMFHIILLHVVIYVYLLL